MHSIPSNSISLALFIFNKLIYSAFFLYLPMQNQALNFQRELCVWLLWKKATFLIKVYVLWKRRKLENFDLNRLKSANMPPTIIEYRLCHHQRQHAKAVEQSFTCYRESRATSSAWDSDSTDWRAVSSDWTVTFSATFSFATKFPNKAPLEETPYFIHTSTTSVSKAHTYSSQTKLNDQLWQSRESSHSTHFQFPILYPLTFYTTTHHYRELQTIYVCN